MTVDREIRDRLEAALNEQGQCPYMGTRRWLPHHGERRSRAPMASMTIPPAIDRFGMRREPPRGIYAATKLGNGHPSRVAGPIA